MAAIEAKPEIEAAFSGTRPPSPTSGFAVVKASLRKRIDPIAFPALGLDEADTVDISTASKRLECDRLIAL